MGQWLKKALEWQSYLLLRGIAALFALFLLIALISVPTGNDQNLISAFLYDNEYGILSDERHQAAKNRENAERTLAALSYVNFDTSQEPLKFLASYAPDATCTDHYNSEISNFTCSTDAASKVVQADQPNLQLVNQSTKPPKPYKMNEYDFDPELLSLQCRPDFDYCITTCDHNENGRVDDDVVREVQCVAYCMRQAVGCEYNLCKDNYEKRKASIFKWGGIIFLVTFLLIILPPTRPLGAATFLVGVLMMFFSASPLMTWIGYMQCG